MGVRDNAVLPALKREEGARDCRCVWKAKRPGMRMPGAPGHGPSGSRPLKHVAFGPVRQILDSDLQNKESPRVPFEGTQLPVFCHGGNRGLTHSSPHPVINTGVFLGECQSQEGSMETPDSHLGVWSHPRLCTQASCSHLDLSRLGGSGGPGVQVRLKHLVHRGPVLNPMGGVSLAHSDPVIAASFRAGETEAQRG